ncbi:MAG: NPCBM/NEW2 domain-containing protein [Planctomycetales bacterium]
MRCWQGVGALLALVVWATELLAAPPRFSVLLQSGKLLEGAEIKSGPNGEQRLDNHKLSDPADPPLWIEDRALHPAAPPTAFVEYSQGDLIPGRVATYRSGRESPYRPHPPHFLLVADQPLDLPDAPRPEGIPVQARWLRRVVWQRRDQDRYQPGSLFARDGRQVPFRALRWMERSVRLLMDQETSEFPFDDIAEVHLPLSDPWDAWLEQLALLAPDGTGRLVQYEAIDGMRVTGNAERLLARQPAAGQTEGPLHGMQPAWSLEPLWLKPNSIRWRRYFEPQLPPLTLFEPSRSVSRTSLGGARTWQRDKSVQQLPLRCAGRPFGWGWGVHAYSELSFDLPQFVEGFRSQYGLDYAAGRGGSVQAAVFIGPTTGDPVHRSPVLVGSLEVGDTGIVPISGTDEPSRRLTLVVDPLLEKRPPQSDPLEIRDMFDWLQPTLSLNPAHMQTEIARRFGSTVPAWQDWTIAHLDRRPVVISTTLDPSNPKSPRFVPQAAPAAGWYALTRQLEILPEHQFLMIDVARFHKEQAASHIQVVIDGQAVAEFEPPLRGESRDADPQLIPIHRWRKSTASVEVRHLGAPLESRLGWQSMGLAAFDVRLPALLDDAAAAAFVESLNSGAGAATVDTAERFVGQSSVRISGGFRQTDPAAPVLGAIRLTPRLGEYRFLRFAWKKKGGARIGLHLAHHGQWGATEGTDPRAGFRYRCGPEEGQGGQPGFVLRDRAPEQWEVVVRDLAADFGEFDLTGLRLAAPDGEAAWFDQIYLARRPQDFERLPVPGQPAAKNLLAGVPEELKTQVEQIVVDPLQYGEVLNRVAPQFSTAASEQGVWLLREHRGRPTVVRTHPPRQDTPCILRAAVTVPPDRQTEVRLAVAHHQGGDWQLVVKVGTDKLHDQPISGATTTDGWADLSVDLSRYAGQNIVVELHNQPTGWSNEFAYWGKIDIVTP